MSESGTSDFVQETVYSTIPLALPKAEQDLAKMNGVMDEDGAAIEGKTARKMSSGDDPKELTPVEIVWKGGGKMVYVARASDDNWKGRRPMHRA